jgi:hypothetical protein
MKDIHDIAADFEQTLVQSNLLDMTADLSEVVIDEVLNEGILKEIPVISTIIRAINVSNSIGNYLFAKKLVAFIYGVRDVDPKRRKKEIEKIDKSEKYQIKIGEKLLFILDRCDDYEKARYIAHLFRAFLVQKISYDEFLKAAHVVERIYMHYLKYFIDDIEEFLMIEDAQEEIASGLFYIAAHPPKIRCEPITTKKDKPSYIIEDGVPTAHITHVGRVIRKVFTHKKSEYRWGLTN